ncbi:bifunctional non-homologous end joining protein LigD [Sedimentibacter acidaminivorans]|uniref:DNA ligase (ATP) n=1 Tax=Sedimentibacter acidaminivorans TaxID=913099 RepID=A0ABS4G9R5_9FIRM|nr:DNA ligase D [Sedimentibacter acidaminivorans]MBP1924421.1 bifunctional non-homologous end joining protein LigD [Sedimentibacter acidaminivorans]
MTAKLSEYNQKRNFERTFEPEGNAENSGEGLRFVVQHHMARRDHYDLRLEWEGVLLSWAVPKGPSCDTHNKRLAVQVENHPLEYRNFEGTIPKGEYGGGVIMLWDEGFWEPHGNVEEGLSEGALKFILKGRRLKGKWALVRLKAKDGERSTSWLLLKEKDEYVKSVDGISEFNTSIRTGRTMIEIEAGQDEKITRNPFSVADVQLAKLVNKSPEGDDWLYELKYDGFRIVAFVEGNNVRLITRNGNDYSKRFYEITSSLIDWAAGRAMVLDGEMAITDASGKTDFHALQNYMKNSKTQNLTYIVFDLLALDGRDFRGYQLIERKEMLETLMKDAPKNLYYSRYVRGNAKESFVVACETGMEGIIGKKADSIYSGTRNGDWIKLKCDKRQEFIIGGYSLTDKKISGVSSILLGVYEGGKLVYAGRAGTGISETDTKVLEEKFRNLKRIDSPFNIAPKTRSKEKITWLEPELVAEIKFAEWTKDNLLRQASFKGIRTDKDPKEIKREKVECETQHEPPVKEVEKTIGLNANSIIVEGIKISNPDKVIFDNPEITKEDVIRYYEKVSKRMLTYVSHRILSIVRCPKGISQTCFYKKHPGPNSKGIITIPTSNSSGEKEDYFYIDKASGIIYEVQMGTLEFHTWGSTVDELEKPDVMVFDLDPDEGMDLSQVRQGVLDIKDILSQLSLISYLKTSGGKGYHVVVPFKPVVTWDVFHDFARRVAEVMEQKWPERYTSNVRKAKRTNKIFIDWIRNGRGATSIAPYSLRARKGARVSMPIAWDELDTVAPDGINMSDALLRIAGDDPWKGFFQNNQMLK